MSLSQNTNIYPKNKNMDPLSHNKYTRKKHYSIGHSLDLKGYTTSFTGNPQTDIENKENIQQLMIEKPSRILTIRTRSTPSQSKKPLLDSSMSIVNCDNTLSQRNLNVTNLQKPSLSTIKRNLNSNFFSGINSVPLNDTVKHSSTAGNANKHTSGLIYPNNKSSYYETISHSAYGSPAMAQRLKK